jgi:hypothetical protein
VVPDAGFAAEVDILCGGSLPRDRLSDTCLCRVVVFTDVNDEQARPLRW